MNRKLCCAVLVMLVLATTAVVAGPYSSLNGEVVKIGSSYQTTVPIGNGNQRVEAIEYSGDGFIYGVNSALGALIRIDPSTGVAETVGPLGIDLDGTADLDEDDQGRLWLLQGGTGGLYQIDRVSGAASLLCQANSTSLRGLVTLNGTFYTSTFQTNPPDPGCGLEFIDGHAPYLERGPEGWIHTLTYWYLPQFVYCVFSRLDPTTGVREELGTFVYFWDILDGLTFDPTDQAQPIPGIPTLGWQGLTILATLLAVWGVLIVARVSVSRTN